MRRRRRLRDGAFEREVQVALRHRLSQVLVEREVGDRAVLATAGSGPASVERMRDAFEIPDSTLYRRLPELVDCGLLTERTCIDADGNHYRVYETAFERLTVEADAGAVNVRVALPDDETLIRTWRTGVE